jgi:hypothetical protein
MCIAARDHLTSLAFTLISRNYCQRSRGAANKRAPALISNRRTEWWHNRNAGSAHADAISPTGLFITEIFKSSLYIVNQLRINHRLL